MSKMMSARAVGEAAEVHQVGMGLARLLHANALVAGAASSARHQRGRAALEAKGDAGHASELGSARGPANGPRWSSPTTSTGSRRLISAGFHSACTYAAGAKPAKRLGRLARLSLRRNIGGFRD